MISTWVLFLSLAMHPHYQIENKTAVYKTEAACKKALEYAMAKVEDGVILIGKCEPRR